MSGVDVKATFVLTAAEVPRETRFSADHSCTAELFRPRIGRATMIFAMVLTDTRQPVRLAPGPSGQPVPRRARR